MNQPRSCSSNPRLPLFIGLAAVAFLAKPPFAVGQAASLLDLSLEALSQVEIKTDITSIRAKPIEEQPGIVSVVTSEQVHQTGARDLSDVLMLVPGFALDTDVESMIGLTFRGLQGQEGKVLLIVDGMEINEPLYGSLPILNHIPAEAIKQVEIIRGPGNAQYGGDAGLAVVRVTTQDSNQNGGYAVLSPSYASGRFSESYAAGAGFAKGDWRWSVNAAYTSTTLSNRTYVALDGTTVDLTHAANMNPLFFDFGLGWRDLDIKLIYDRYRYDDVINYGETVTTANATRFDSLLAMAKYDFRVNESLRITPSFSYRSQVPWYVNGADGVYDVHAETYVGNVVAVADLTAKSSVLVGVQWMRESAYVHDSSFYGQDPTTYFNGSPSIAYNDTAEFAQYDLDTALANFSFGGRYERQDAVGGHFVPRFALTKAWGPWHLKALASQAIRIPAINVLQEAVGGALKPEQTTNYEIELGYKFAEKRSLTGNVFYMAVDRPIVFETLPGGAESEGYFNGHRISSSGFETEYRWTQGDFENYLGYSFYRAVNNDEPYVRGDSGRFVGSPTHKLSASSTWRPTKKLDVNLNAYWLSSELAYTYPTQNLTELGSQFVANAFLNYRLGKTSIGLGVSNLFDVKRYAPQPYNGGEAPIPLMGRTVFLKLGYRF
jgi:outer membrane receptor protein involved in Fe transport